MKILAVVSLHILLLFGIENKIVAQSDYLISVEENAVNCSFYRLEYYYSIRDVLFKELEPKPEIRYLTLSHPVYVLDIEQNVDEAKYYIICHTFDKRTPVKKNTEKVKLNISKKEISKRSVDLIKELFETAINEARDSNNETGIDGTDYYFFINKNEILHGRKVWSPDKNSKMERLVKIGNLLIGLAKSKEEIVEFNPKFTKRIIDFTNELKHSSDKKKDYGNIYIAL